MTATAPSREPDRLSAGTTWTWRRDDLSDYPASAFDLSYAFALFGASPFAINGGQVTADGNSFVVLVPSSTTASLGAGLWKWAARVTAKSGGAITEVDRGDLRILPSLASGDPRTHARRTLDLIELTIEGRASRSDLRYEISVNGSMRRLDSFPMADLMGLRNAYRAEVKAEEERDRVAQGRGGRRRVLTRFTKATGSVPPTGWPFR